MNMMESMEHWTTLDLLTGRDGRRTDRELVEEVQEWLEAQVARRVQWSAATTPKGQCTLMDWTFTHYARMDGLRLDQELREWVEAVLHVRVGDDDSSDTATLAGVPDLPLTTNHRQTPLYPLVDVSFSQPRVRSRLERLMGTNVVRITDRNYMQKLQIRIREDHEENVRKRIHDREVGEVEREKHLILEGKMAVEEAPEELANHPVFKITQMTNKILEEKRQEAEAKSMNQLMKKLQNYELSLPESKDEKEEKESERSIELDEAEIERARRLREIEETMSAGALFTQEDYDRIKYESPLVKQLRSVEDVDELYRLADQIVGPLKAKKR